MLNAADLPDNLAALTAMLLASEVRAPRIETQAEQSEARLAHLAGRIEIDNSAAERALRGIALGRRNHLCAGADSGGERAAAMFGLIGTAKLNGIAPEA